MSCFESAAQKYAIAEVLHIRLERTLARMETLTDRDIEAARKSDEPVFELMFLLKIEMMLPADYVRTKREIIEYVQTGDLGAGRALIQHAKGRREQRRHANL